jgi:hypothetical protein
MVLAVLIATASPALAAVDTDAALDYLATQQNADGGFGSGFSPDSTPGSTADAVLAIIAAGGDPTSFEMEGITPVSYLEANVGSVVLAGDLAKVILATVAAGENPRSFGGIDAVATLEGMVGADGKIGVEGDTLVGHSLAVLALASARRPIPAAAVAYIVDAQQQDGSWAWDGSAGIPGDTNTAAFAVQALIAAGEPAGGDPVEQALAYFASLQNADGGWPYQNPSDYGTDTDANSTAVVIQAILATGQDPGGENWAIAEGNTPMSALEGLQNESGAFAWQAAMPDANLLATVQALPAVAGKAFPFATMDVGELEAAGPATMPETGGVALGPIAAALAGLGLAGSGMVLRRRQR